MEGGENSMIVYFGNLKVEGEPIVLDTLRIKLETDSMAYNELYEIFHENIFKELSIQKHNDAQRIAEALGRVEE